MRKILRFCAIAAVFFAMSNIIIGAAAAQTESFRPADVQTEILKSWSREIKDATKRFEVLDRFNDEAVLDRETQLVWQREPKCSGLHTVAPRPANKGHFRLTFRANKRRLEPTLAANEPTFRANGPQTTR